MVVDSLHCIDWIASWSWCIGLFYSLLKSIQRGLYYGAKWEYCFTWLLNCKVNPYFYIILFCVSNFEFPGDQFNALKLRWVDQVGLCDGGMDGCDACE